MAISAYMIDRVLNSCTKPFILDVDSDVVVYIGFDGVGGSDTSSANFRIIKLSDTGTGIIEEVYNRKFDAIWDDRATFFESTTPSANMTKVPDHDVTDITYPTSTTELLTYKLGGVSVGTLEITYVDFTKSKILKVDKQWA